MVFILGASCLYRALNTLPHDTKRELQIITHAVSGLSFVPYAEKTYTRAQEFLNSSQAQGRTDIVVWHDAINNSLTPHRNNSNRPLQVNELVHILSSFKPQIAAIIYVRRDGTVDNFEELKATGIIVINAYKKLLSLRKQKDHFFKKELVKLHPNPNIELKFLDIIFEHQDNLKALLKHRRGKNNGNQKTKKQRKAARKLRSSSPSAGPSTEAL